VTPVWFAWTVIYCDDAVRCLRPKGLSTAGHLASPMAKREFHVIVERDEDGWYVGEVAELPGCHTQAKSLDQLHRRIREAAEAYLEDAGRSRPALKFVGVQAIEV